jgi:hypothetical protein
LERYSDPLLRRSQQVLLMVHELHTLGYQRLRIVPGMSPSGMHWRCSVTHFGNIQPMHGAMMCDFDDAAHYTTGQDNNSFGWEGAQKDTARQLASNYLDLFPAIAQLGQGADWPYAAWYVQMLCFAERGVLPVAYADWCGEPDPRWLPITAGLNSGLPMPTRVEGIPDA